MEAVSVETREEITLADSEEEEAAVVTEEVVDMEVNPNHLEEAEVELNKGITKILNNRCVHFWVSQQDALKDLENAISITRQQESK